MQRLLNLSTKLEKLVVGIMSGTSVDGVDVALVKIKGYGKTTEVELIEFENYDYSREIRERIFRLFNNETSTVEQISQMNFLLGALYADCVFKICEKARISVKKLDLIGSHGQTIFHHPHVSNIGGHPVSSTLQIGEGSIIAKRTGIITINDFRVGDMSVNGLGAPLVPYPEYLMYRETTKTIALQNIGGIGNVTILPKGCQLEEVYAFDTGPGNMVIDGVISVLTNGVKVYDVGGEMAAQGIVNDEFITELLKDSYFKLCPPKTTGREYFGELYVNQFINKGRQWGLSDVDLVANATALTAKSIADAYQQFVHHEINQLVIGGGGSYNRTLLNLLRKEFSCPVMTQEELGLNSDAKEAIAFAILANETIHGQNTNVPSVTGAESPTILGKIIL